MSTTNDEVLIDSVRDALDQWNNDEDVFVENIKFGGELSSFTAHIDGKNYNSSIPSELARGLWEFQEELYRAAAFALYGSDDIRKLTAEQRTHFQLVFKVNEGSTGLSALIGGFLEKLAEGITNMDSVEKKKTIIAVALILAVAWGGISVAETYSDLKKEEIKAEMAANADQQQTLRLQEFSKFASGNAVAARFSKATEEGTRSIVKGASDAKDIKVGKVHFDKEAIQEVNQRATKEKADARIYIEDFVIVRMEFKDSSTRVWLAAAGTGEFPVTIIDDETDADSKKKIWDAAEARRTVKLEVNATVIRGTVRTAQLVRVL